MNKHFEDFSAAMRDIRVPLSAQDATRKAIAAARVDAATAAAAPKQAARLPRPVGWYVAAGCAVATVALVALGISGIMTSANKEGENRAVNASAAPNSFTLVAYAGDVPLAGTEELAVNPESEFAAWGNWSVGPSVEISCDLAFDLTCTGDNIETLSYHIEGDGFAFALRKKTPKTDEQGETTYHTNETVSTRWETTPQELEDYLKSGTIPFIRVALTMTDEIQRALDQRNELSERYPFKAQGDASWNALPDEAKQAIREADKDLDAAMRTAAAQCMPEATLDVTATFTDGSEQTHRYRLVPVKDFEERYSTNDRSEDASSLFTIEQID